MARYRPRSKTRPCSRIDWGAIRETIDLAEVIARVLGPPPGRRGARSSRPWWSCPFHEDANPSLTLTRSGRGFKCFGCGASGDAAAFVMKALNISFPEAVAYLPGGPASSGETQPRPKLGPRP